MDSVWQLVLIISVALLNLPSSFAQDNPTDSLSFKLQTELDVAAKYFTTDKLQNIYVVNKRNDLIKYNSKGEVLFEFNNNFMGTLGLVDATDPFNILLYYPEYLTIVSLDRTLSKTGQFNLYELDVALVKAVGMSNDNNVWIYDPATFKLKKINRAGTVLVESDNVTAIVNADTEVDPNFILERENWVYVNVPAEGILVFDNFGQFAKTLPFKNLSEFQVMADQIVFIENNQLHLYHQKSLFTKSIALPGEVGDDVQVRIQKDLLFVLEDGKIGVYGF